MKFRDQFIKLIKQEMPSAATIRKKGSERDLDVEVYWELNNVPARPNKILKTISICIPHETLRDFADATTQARLIALERFQKILKRKIKGFNPDHAAQKHE